MLETAFAFGADAIYAGQPRYSLRVRNNDFGDIEVLKQGIDRAHELGRKFFLVSNIFPHGNKIKNYVTNMAPVIALEARRHDHVRPRPDHDGARDLARDGDPPLGAGQHRQLGRGAGSGTRSASSASSCRASCRWTRWSRSARTARTASSKCSCTARCASPTRAAACCRVISTTATPTRAVAPTPAAGTTRRHTAQVDASGDVLSPQRAAGHELRSGRDAAQRGARLRSPTCWRKASAPASSCRSRKTSTAPT